MRSVAVDPYSTPNRPVQVEATPETYWHQTKENAPTVVADATKLPLRARLNLTASVIAESRVSPDRVAPGYVFGPKRNV